MRRALTFQVKSAALSNTTITTEGFVAREIVVTRTPHTCGMQFRRTPDGPVVTCDRPIPIGSRCMVHRTFNPRTREWTSVYYCPGLTCYQPDER